MNPKKELFTIRNGIIEDSHQNFFIDYEYLISSPLRLSQIEKSCGITLEKDISYNKWIFYKENMYFYTISRLDNIFCAVPLRLIDINFKEHFDFIFSFVSFIVSKNSFSFEVLNKFHYTLYFYVPQNLITTLITNLCSNGMKPGSLLGKAFIYPFCEFYREIHFDKDYNLMEVQPINSLFLNNN